MQAAIEHFWSENMEKQPFDENNPREKYYVLSMFPYPSGNLHLGHVAIYLTTDVYARYYRFCGKNVLNPMGWDAFGLPAENAAIEQKVDSVVWTEQNIEHMKSVLQALNFSFDWSREITTCSPEYYKWTQFLFLKLYENGLVYRSKEFVNWDPVDQTVLADEQVDENGLSWRSGAKVEQRLLVQWFVRTSRFSKNLIEGLDELRNEHTQFVEAMQRNWIGKCDGSTFDFEIVENESRLDMDAMTIWTKNPEWLRHVKYVAVRPGSRWSSDKGVSGRLPYKLKNPITQEIVPVYSTEQLEYPDGRDCVFGIPELSETDRSFANSVGLQYSPSANIITDEGELAEIRRKVCEEARKLGVGGYEVSSKVRDWLISRQRRWGTPIPIVHCGACGPQPVRESDLPVLMPRPSSANREGKTLELSDDWLNTTCPKCGGAAKREVDTMDTFVDSSWYFLRYIDPRNVDAPFSVEKAKNVMPVDLYLGGEEHATLHLYYARFFSHFLHSVGLLPQREPFKELLMQPVVRAKTYRFPSTGEYVNEKDVEIDGNIARHKGTKEKLTWDWQKMSKSKKNGVDAKLLLSEYGSDAVRIAVSLMCGVKRAQDWNGTDLKGALSFQNRNWNLISKFKLFGDKSREIVATPESLRDEEARIRESRNYSVYYVNFSLSRARNLSMAVRKTMGFLNILSKKDHSEEVYALSSEFEKSLAHYIILTALFAPCLANEMWRIFTGVSHRISAASEIRWDKPLYEQAWPQPDPHYVPQSSLLPGTIKSRYEHQLKIKKKLKQ